MSQPIIQVQNLSKRFIIGHQKQEAYTSFRDVIAGNVKGVFRRTRELISGNYMTEGDVEEEFWALKDLNFSINKGDRVGIIGRNGAGKSTLLKILSRITEPTHGRITIRGRIASLLEVGTGFHPELTGRENIFLNGAILGMSRAEIRKKFDEIVAFAEIEKFLDTPVKRYSSGMYVRLAFSIAAHLEPEILIVDEVLAVGDAQFQKKCLGKMEDVSKGEGRTVLFVSHQLSAIEVLCNRAILLNKGQVLTDDVTSKVVSSYMLNGSNNVKDTNQIVDCKGAQIHSFELLIGNESVKDENKCIKTGQEFGIKFSIKNGVETRRNVKFNLELKTMSGTAITSLGNQFNGFELPIHQISEFVVEVNAKGIHLTPGIYVINLWYDDPALPKPVYKEEVLRIEVIESDFYGTGLIPNMPQQGSILAKHIIRSYRREE